MAYCILFAGHVPGISGNYDTFKSQNRHSFILWNPASARWAVVRNVIAFSILLIEEKDLDLEQKKTTQWVVSLLPYGKMG